MPDFGGQVQISFPVGTTILENNKHYIAKFYVTYDTVIQLFPIGQKIVM
jgi:hypothetical protein